MADEDALMLLKTKVSVDGSSEDEARTLVQTLERIPLAATHAAAYIAVREPSITVSTYLELFCESEENQACLVPVVGECDNNPVKASRPKLQHIIPAMYIIMLRFSSGGKACQFPRMVAIGEYIAISVGAPGKLV